MEVDLVHYLDLKPSTIIKLKSYFNSFRQVYLSSPTSVSWPKNKYFEKSNGGIFQLFGKSRINKTIDLFRPKEFKV